MGLQNGQTQIATKQTNNKIDCIHIETNYTERRKNTNISWKQTGIGSQRNYFTYLFIITHPLVIVQKYLLKANPLPLILRLESEREKDRLSCSFGIDILGKTGKI